MPNVIKKNDDSNKNILESETKCLTINELYKSLKLPSDYGFVSKVVANLKEKGHRYAEASVRSVISGSFPNPYIETAILDEIEIYKQFVNKIRDRVQEVANL